MISLTNYDFQWARSELVIIYPDMIRLIRNFVCGHVVFTMAQQTIPGDARSKTRCKVKSRAGSHLELDS